VCAPRHGESIKYIPWTMEPYREVRCLCVCGNEELRNVDSSKVLTRGL